MNKPNYTQLAGSCTDAELSELINKATALDTPETDAYLVALRAEHDRRYPNPFAPASEHFAPTCGNCGRAGCAFCEDTRDSEAEEAHFAHNPKRIIAQDQTGNGDFWTVNLHQPIWIGVREREIQQESDARDFQNMVDAQRIRKAGCRFATVTLELDRVSYERFGGVLPPRSDVIASPDPEAEGEQDMVANERRPYVPRPGMSWL